MIQYSRFTLPNGLRIIVHEDRSTPLVTMNLLYDVGSRDEDPEWTGLAHLFEHLMFGGSVNIPDFDMPLQLVGAENNAFTNNDITNYYITIPSDNIETAFWLESDRMLGLNFSQKGLDTQKNVVIEEYKQRYLNQPYGDAILMLRPLAYRVHPYRWSTIGLDISHIEKVELEQVKDFFYSHYAPNNAILSLAGNITPERAVQLARKWFGPIERRKIKERHLPCEPFQNEERRLTAEKDVPADAMYKVWHTDSRLSHDFQTLDLLTDILAGGESGRLNTRLVREKKLFSEINAYITSDLDPGLLVLHGNIMKDIDIECAEKAVNELIKELKIPGAIPLEEMDKIKNRFESSTVFSNTSALNKAVNLAFYELLEKPEMINTEIEIYRQINSEMVEDAARRYLSLTNCSTLYYKSARKNR
ncbi:MAG TPA: pitrilysin family protein [Bacteroidales bacterium]|nr:pitrilysin family protein [Bacteroidales bacterium]